MYCNWSFEVVWLDSDSRQFVDIYYHQQTMKASITYKIWLLTEFIIIIYNVGKTVKLLIHLELVMRYFF